MEFCNASVSHQWDISNYPIRSLFASSVHSVSPTISFCTMLTLYEAAGANIPFWDGPVLPRAWLMLNLRGCLGTNSHFVVPFKLLKAAEVVRQLVFFDRSKLSQYTDVVQCFNTQGEYDAELKKRSRVWNLLECVSWRIQRSLSSLAANVKATSEAPDVIFHPSFEQNSYFSQFMNLAKIRLLISPRDTEKIILYFGIVLLPFMMKQRHSSTLCSVLWKAFDPQWK